MISGNRRRRNFIDGRLRSRGHEEAGVAPAESFLSRINVHTIDGYNVRGQVIALVREHLKPGEFYKKRDEVGEGAFRRLARRCEPDLLYRVAKADSLGTQCGMGAAREMVRSGSAGVVYRAHQRVGGGAASA
jgi:hypothetical protein